MNEQDLINLENYKKELALAQQQQANQTVAYSNTMFNNAHKQNLIEYELDFKEELEEIERLLRCDIMVKDNNGNYFWTENPDQSRIFLNNLGVSDVLRKIRLVVNKGKVLSNYNLDEIKVRVKMLQNDLRVLIYNNYEDYGIDNDYKMNNYSMVILAIGSVVEDAYRRAMNGETHKGLNEQRIVTQNEGLNQSPNVNINMPTQKNKHWYNPLTYFK